jgi:hypothetical protein
MPDAFVIERKFCCRTFEAHFRDIAAKRTALCVGKGPLVRMRGLCSKFSGQLTRMPRAG